MRNGSMCSQKTLVAVMVSSLHSRPFLVRWSSHLGLMGQMFDRRAGTQLSAMLSAFLTCADWLYRRRTGLLGMKNGTSDTASSLLDIVLGEQALVDLIILKTNITKAQLEFYKFHRCEN